MPNLKPVEKFGKRSMKKAGQDITSPACTVLSTLCHNK